MNDTLPITTLLPDLLTTLAQRTTVVLEAPPGSGKTTRVPLALLTGSGTGTESPADNEPAWLAGKRIVMLEPRRLAARSAARYMASLLGEPIGQRVGYRTRLDTRVSAATRIEVVTEGILSRLLRDDPELNAYGAVIFDEFHERSLQADLGLALVRECQDVLREDLRLIVMSATLDPGPLSRLLGNAPVLSCDGRMYPVEVRYRPPGRTPLPDPLQQHLRLEILRLLREETGSLLVFLPGEGEIRRLAERLQDAISPDVELCPLYGQLAAEAQDRAISPSPAGRRKIVLATAIAETSLTIEGIRIVVDAGQMRTPRFDPGSGMTRLVTQRVAQANAEQRRGRAGRLGPGLCIRLWSEEEQQRLRAFATPEILEADLADLVLELAAWGVRDGADMAWLDVPPAPAWAQARELLQGLGALNADGGITPHGQAMLKPGLPPRLAHLLVRGRDAGLGRLAADLAALLAERDLLGWQAGADIHARLALLRGERHDTRADQGRLRLVRDSARRLTGSGNDQSDGKRGDKSRAEHRDSPADVGRLLALAWPDGIARRRPGREPRYLLANGRGAMLAPDDPLAGEPWLVAVELDGQSREARIFQAAPVDQADIETLFASHISQHDEFGWDAASAAVTARRSRRLGAITLSENPLPRPDPETLLPAFIAGLQETGSSALPWTPALRQWQARVGILHRLDPEVWPDVSDAALMASLADWAAPWLQGLSRLSELTGFPLHDALTSRLDWPQQQTLAQQLPESLVVPSGSSVDIDYTPEHGPVLAVKLQEMFGLSETPRLAQGRVALTLHLLSPARRPTAVTSDLASFWRQGYPEVRKDLRGRYPKHPWPEDPLTAPAQRGVKHPAPR